MSGPRLLVVGVDGLPHRLARHALDAGLLPHLGRFVEGAPLRPLRCTWPPHTATGWPSLFSGRLPGEHGLFAFWDCQDPDYRLRVVERGELGVPSLWDALAGAGWTLGLVNLPMFHPAGDWPGFQITWPLRPTLHFVRPPSLARDLARAGGRVRPDIACMYDGQEDYPEQSRVFLEERVHSALHLLRNEAVDALAVVFTELDRICHHYWHAADPGHRLHAAAPAARRGAVADVLVAVDDAFGRLLAEVGDDCVVAVVSDHGFGPGERGLRLHRLLADLGLCALPAGGTAGAGDGGAPDRDLEVTSTLPPLDWSRTTAYMPVPGSFAVNLNLRGRQAAGVVAPADREATLERVAAALAAVEDPADGGPLFAAVVPGRRAWAGRFAAAAPDLLMVPRDPALMLLGDVAGPTWDGPGQTGLHRLEGVWAVRGGATRASLPATTETVAVEAVAGDLLDRLAVAAPEIPRHRDPDRAAAALAAAGLPADAWSAQHDRALDLTAGAAPPPRPRAEPPTASAATAPVPADDIERRLRAMGYL